MNEMSDSETDVRPGDTREGIGGMRVRVRVLRIREKDADCVLVRSGTPKVLTMQTLRKSYRLVSRGEPPASPAP